MTRQFFAILLLLALAGLTFVQFRLLLIGIGLEKEQFDVNIEASLREVGRSLNEPNELSDRLIHFFSQTGNDKAFEISKAIDSLFHSELHQNGLSAQFVVAMTDKSDTQVFLASENFDQKDFKFGRYSLLLGSRIISECNCERKLHLDVPNLFGYLLGELVYLIIPSIFCLLAILVGFAFLLNTLRKEEKLNAIKNDFINNLTHELKTPAFSISLSAKLTKESLDKGELDKAKRYLQLIGNENEKMKNHIDKVLELASLESGRYTLKKEAVDLHLLTREVVSEFLPQAEARNGKIEMVFEAKKSTMQVDKAHFKNLIGNLLDNALKYTPGSPAIYIKTTHENGQFKLSVTDNGPGIDPAWRKQVFEKFFRAPTGNVQEVKGFGLGLSYVKQIAEAHRGRVELESGIGRGTIVTLMLPIHLPKKEHETS